jgi:hypothetical protein
MRRLANDSMNAGEVMGIASLHPSYELAKLSVFAVTVLDCTP